MGRERWLKLGMIKGSCWNNGGLLWLSTLSLMLSTLFVSHYFRHICGDSHVLRARPNYQNGLLYITLLEDIRHFQNDCRERNCFMVVHSFIKRLKGHYFNLWLGLFFDPSNLASKCKHHHKEEEKMALASLLNCIPRQIKITVFGKYYISRKNHSYQRWQSASSKRPPYCY